MAVLQTCAIVSVAGLASGGGAEFKSYTGSTGGTSTVNIASTAAQSAVFDVSCMFAHSGYIVSYGCSRKCQVSTGNSLTDIRDDTSTNTSNGGSWSISKISNANTAIVKNDGNYPGGGYYTVNMWGWDMQ